MASTVNGDPEIEILKIRMSQLIEMMTRSSSQVIQVTEVDTATPPRLYKEVEQFDIKSEIATLKIQMSEMMEMMNLLIAKFSELFNKVDTGPSLLHERRPGPSRRTHT